MTLDELDAEIASLLAIPQGSRTYKDYSRLQILIYMADEMRTMARRTS